MYSKNITTHVSMSYLNLASYMNVLWSPLPLPLAVPPALWITRLISSYCPDLISIYRVWTSVSICLSTTLVVIVIIQAMALYGCVSCPARATT